MSVFSYIFLPFELKFYLTGKVGQKSEIFVCLKFKRPYFVHMGTIRSDFSWETLLMDYNQLLQISFKW